MSCPACFSGHVNNGTPTGREAVVFGRNAYIAEPKAGVAAKGIVVIIPDAFGWQFVNNRILADHYAARGDFKVYLPDFMDGNSAPPWLLQNTDKLFDTSLMGWITKPYHIAWVLYGGLPFMLRNKFPISYPKVTAFLEALRAEEGSKLPVAAAGFCWGGKHTINLAHGEKGADGRNLIDVGFTAHPSNLEIPGEIEKITLPLAIAHPDKDMTMTEAKIKLVQETLATLKDVDTEVVVYKDATHGFSVRANPEKNEAKQSVEAEEQAVRWFKKHFKTS